MKKLYSLNLLFVLFFIVSFLIPKIILAFGLPVGGQILYNKAIEIQRAESAGLFCTIHGNSITIRPTNSAPMSYIIPKGIQRTSTPIFTGQSMLGIYSGVTYVICSNARTTTTIPLPTLILFGNSPF